MATINFLYRSTKQSAFLTCRLQFRIWTTDTIHKDIFIDGKSNRYISKEDWKIYYSNRNKKSKLLEVISLKNSIENEISEITKFILTDFDIESYDNYDKKWLQLKLDTFYNKESKKEKPVVPTELISFMNYYIENKEYGKNTLGNIRSLISKLKVFEDYRGGKIEITEINYDFSEELSEYFDLEEYAPSTTERDFRTIRTFCSYARKKGIELSIGFDDFKYRISKRETQYPILSLQEIEKVKNLDKLTEYLDNARDWLLISLYTGQRISDFLQFSSKNIRTERNVRLLEFTQVKTKKTMTIPIFSEVEKVLAKRNGEFPRQLSDQKYNDYIKEVVELAGITEKIEGYKILIDEKTKRRRRVKDIYFKYELISSHCGRRSFATNYYGILPTSDLMYITGHSKESIFLTYINKSSSDRAHDIALRFKQLDL